MNPEIEGEKCASAVAICKMVIFKVIGSDGSGSA